MDPYERSKIADALKSYKCQKGEYVVKQVIEKKILSIFFPFYISFYSFDCYKLCFSFVCIHISNN